MAKVTGSKTRETLQATRDVKVHSVWAVRSVKRCRQEELGCSYMLMRDPEEERKDRRG